MENKEKYLELSGLSEPDERIEEIANSFSGSKKEKIRGISKWIGRNLEQTEFEQEKFRQRSAREIVKTGKHTGCSDIALVFVTLARLCGIPTKHVYLAEGKIIEERGVKESGHAVAECFIEGEWTLIDPKKGFLEGIPEKYTLVGKGKDWKEIGVYDWESMKKAHEKYGDKKCRIRILEKVFDWVQENSKEEEKYPELLKEIMRKGLEKAKEEED